MEALLPLIVQSPALLHEWRPCPSSARIATLSFILAMVAFGYAILPWIVVTPQGLTDLGYPHDVRCVKCGAAVPKGALLNSCSLHFEKKVPKDSSPGLSIQRTELPSNTNVGGMLKLFLRMHVCKVVGQLISLPVWPRFVGGSLDSRIQHVPHPITNGFVCASTEWTLLGGLMDLMQASLLCVYTVSGFGKNCITPHSHTPLEVMTLRDVNTPRTLLPSNKRSRLRRDICTCSVLTGINIFALAV